MPPRYTYPAVALPRFLDDASRDYPHVTAIRYRGAQLNYGSLQDLTDAAATALERLGVGPGTHVALALPNLPVWPVVAFAVWRLGGVVVLISPWEAPDEALRILVDARCTALVATSAFVSALPVELGELPVRTVVTTEPATWQGRGRVARVLRRRRRLTERSPGDAHALADLLAEPAGRRSTERIDPATLAVIAYTGGRTGDRKGVMLTHANLVANAFQARLWVPDIQAGKERLLAATPFTHLYGLTLSLLAGVLSAATLVVVDDPTGAALVRAISDERPTLFPSLPPLLEAIVHHPAAAKADLTSLRACVCGGGPLDEDVARVFHGLTGNARVREGYGLTEASPLTHANPIYGRADTGRIGLPVTDTIAIVVDPRRRNRVLGVGEVGELAVAGPQVMLGYWQDKAATAAARRGPWLLTGDLAVQDASGSFAIVGRADAEEAAG